MEIWKNINGYEGLYEVSTLGRVRSCDIWISNGKGYRLRKGRILKLQLHIGGYQQVILYKDGKGKMHKVHRLVANAFIPNPNNLPQVNHLDENKTNNRIENLEWCTQEYNNNYGSRTERAAKAKKGKPNIGAKIALSKRVAQIDQNTNEVIKIWPSTAECQRNGFKKGSISQCCQGKRNFHKGYKWQYIDDSFFAMQDSSGIDFPNLDEQCIM